MDGTLLSIPFEGEFLYIANATPVNLNQLEYAPMRIAIISDIHDNLTAFEAVLADLRETSPDLILHGGEIVSGGSSPAEVVDRVRDLGWRGVFGNTDEALARPETLDQFAAQSPAPRSLWDAVREMTAFTRDVLGEKRIAWLGALPRVVIHPPLALVHASPASAWRSPLADAADAELESAYSPLGQAIAVYGHIHQPFVRGVVGLTVINTGSVSQSFDGDPRARIYFLITVRQSSAGPNTISNGKSMRSPRADSRTRLGWRGRFVPHARRRPETQKKLLAIDPRTHSFTRLVPATPG